VIFLDANIFLRALVQSPDPAIQRMHRTAVTLFRQAERGQAEVTTSDAVIAEVAFILTSRAHYGLSPSDAAGQISVLLRLRGVKIRDKRIVLQALDLWATHPKLGFVDALTATYGQRPGIELATFDSDFDRIRGVRRWNANGDSEPDP
jgi:predicted nucleic acid-binding protein